MIVCLIRNISDVPCRKRNSYMWGYPIAMTPLKIIDFDSTAIRLFASFIIGLSTVCTEVKTSTVVCGI